MGGRSSQLGFYYQNLFCILQILERRRDGIIRARVDQKLEDLDIQENGEIDLILEYQDGFKEYYEIKSGLHFAEGDEDIKKSVLTLFKIHKNTNNTDIRSRYFLIFNGSNPGRIMAQRNAQIRTIRGSKYKKALGELSAEWQIDEREHKLFRDFCRNTDLVPWVELTDLRQLCLGKIEEIEDCVGEKVLNMLYKHHKRRAVLKDDLLNRLIILLLDCLDRTSGDIGLEHIVREFTYWCVINAERYGNSGGSDHQERFLEEFQKEFAVVIPSEPSARTFTQKND